MFVRLNSFGQILQSSTRISYFGVTSNPSLVWTESEYAVAFEKGSGEFRIIGVGRFVPYQPN